MASQFLIARIDDIVALGPVAYRCKIDIDQHRHAIAALSDRNGLFDLGIKFDPVLKIFRSKDGVVAELADILGSIDDAKVTPAVDEPGVAAAYPAVRSFGFCRRFIILEISLKDAGTPEQHLATVINLDFDARPGLADRLGIGLPIGLQRDVDA